MSFLHSVPAGRSTGTADATVDASEAQLADELRAHVAAAWFPCPMAKVALAAGQIDVGVYATSASAPVTLQLYSDLGGWLKTRPKGPRSFVALFPEARHDGAQEFHRWFWTVLRALHELEPSPRCAQKGTSDVIDDPLFALNLQGCAFFAIGLSPHSPRLSRRFSVPGIALNPHDQFEQLRASGRMEGVKAASRRQDMRLQGNTNPSLCDHGKRSAAHQYSGVTSEKLPEWP